MRGAILLVVAGVWVLTQVFGGDALGRLGIAGRPGRVEVVVDGRPAGARIRAAGHHQRPAGELLMKGFLAAAAILTAAYVGLQPNGAKAAEGAGGVVVGLLRRLLSADVAGLPNVSHASAAASSTPQAPGPFGGTGGVPLGPTGGPATSPAPVIA